MKFKTLKSAQDEAWFLEGIDGSSAIRICSGLRIGLDNEGAVSLAAENGLLECQVVEDGIQLSLTVDTHELKELSLEPARSTKLASGSETYIELGDNVLKIFSANGDASEEELAAASTASIAEVSRNLQVVGTESADIEGESATTRDVSIASLLRPERTTTNSATVTDLMAVARSNKKPTDDYSSPDHFAEIAAKLTAEKKAADSEENPKDKTFVLKWLLQNSPYVTLSLLLFSAVLIILIAVQVIVSVSAPQGSTPVRLTANSLKAEVTRLIEGNTQFDSQRTLSTARAIIAFQYENPSDKKLDPILHEWVEHLALLAGDSGATIDALVAGRLMQLALLTKVDSHNLGQKIEEMNSSPEPVLPLFQKSPPSANTRPEPTSDQDRSLSTQDLNAQPEPRIELKDNNAVQESAVLKTNAEKFRSPPLQQTPSTQSLTKPLTEKSTQPVKTESDKSKTTAKDAIKPSSDVLVVDLSTPATSNSNRNTKVVTVPTIRDSIALTKIETKPTQQITASVADAKKKEEKSTPEFSAQEESIPYFALSELGVIKRQAPQYPTTAPQGANATVVVNFVVTERGKVDQITLNDNLPFYFQDATLEALRQWEFSPVLQGAQPIPVRSAIRFTFKP